MEKYLVILIVLFIVYYLYSCWTSQKIEGFADAVSIDLADDKNAVNTLANMARDIMAGGFKVAGKLNVADDVTTEKAVVMTTGDKGFKILTEGDNSCWRSNAGDNRIALHKDHGNQTNFGPGGELRTVKLNLRDKHYFNSDDDGWLRLRNKEANAYTNFAAKDIWADGGLNVNGNVVVKGTLKRQLKVIEGVDFNGWQFLDKVAPDFSKTDPDGTSIGYLVIAKTGQVRRYEYVKIGDQIISFMSAVPNATWEYIFGGLDVRKSMPGNGNDGFRKSL